MRRSGEALPATEDELRRLLEKQMRCNIDDSTWKLSMIEEKAGLALYYANTGELDGYNEVINEIRRAISELDEWYWKRQDEKASLYSQDGFQFEETHPVDASVPPTDPSAPIGVLVGAIMAEALAGRVEEFRKRWLNGRVLTPNEVGDWLDEQDRAPFETKEGEGGSQELLWWNGRAYSVEMTHCALRRKRKQPLYELYDLVKDISQRFLCGEERALLYILCNQIPPVSARVNLGWTLPFGVPSVEMRIPLWLPPPVVEKLYEKIRSMYKPVKRFRAPSRRMVEAVTELVMGKLRGESLTQVAARLGVRRNLLSEWYRRACIITTRILTGAFAKGGISREDNET